MTKWLAILPLPLTPKDLSAGYQYQFSILQAEFSLTQIFDRPLTGRRVLRARWCATISWSDCPRRCR